MYLKDEKRAGLYSTIYTFSRKMQWRLFKYSFEITNAEYPEAILNQVRTVIMRYWFVWDGFVPALEGYYAAFHVVEHGQSIAVLEPEKRFAYSHFETTGKQGNRFLIVSCKTETKSGIREAEVVLLFRLSFLTYQEKKQ